MFVEAIGLACWCLRAHIVRLLYALLQGPRKSSGKNAAVKLPPDSAAPASPAEAFAPKAISVGNAPLPAQPPGKPQPWHAPGSAAGSSFGQYPSTLRVQSGGYSNSLSSARGSMHEGLLHEAGSSCSCISSTVVPPRLAPGSGVETQREFLDKQLDFLRPHTVLGGLSFVAGPNNRLHGGV